DDGGGHYRQPQLGERRGRGLPGGLRRNVARRRPHGRGAEHRAPGPRHTARGRGRRPARDRRRGRRDGERGPERPLRRRHSGHPAARHGERAGAGARAAAGAGGSLPENTCRRHVPDGHRGGHRRGRDRAALRLHGRHRLRRRRREGGGPAPQALPQVARIPARRAQGVPQGRPAGTADLGRVYNPRGPVRHHRQLPPLRRRVRDGRGRLLDERRPRGRPRREGGPTRAARRPGPHPGEEPAGRHDEVVQVRQRLRRAPGRPRRARPGADRRRGVGAPADGLPHRTGGGRGGPV
ncbi:MAG: Transcription regulator [contains diacylglycerol kinase catalytic domain], partial [uncultured Rubrobacteraceae bacterium]